MTTPLLSRHLLYRAVPTRTLLWRCHRAAAEQGTRLIPCRAHGRLGFLVSRIDGVETPISYASLPEAAAALGVSTRYTVRRRP